MLALILTALLSPPAPAGIIIGNGTIGLDCGPNKPVELLDLFEAEQYYYRDPSRPKLTLWDPPGETAQQKFFSFIQRLRGHFPQLADSMTKEYAIFQTKSMPVENWTLGDPANALVFAVPSGCTPKTVILQQPRPAFRRTPPYLRAEDLYQRMTPLHQCYTATHETVYAKGLEHGVEHAQGVRYLNALMAASEINLISDAEWIEGFQQARIPNYEAAGMSIPLTSSELKPCDLPAGSLNCIPQLPTWRRTEFQFDDQDQITEVYFGNTGGAIEFTSRDAIRVRATAESFRFERENGELKVAFNGSMAFVSTLTSMGEKKVHFSGSFSPARGTIEGVQMAESGVRPLKGSVAAVFANVARFEDQPIAHSER